MPAMAGRQSRRLSFALYLLLLSKHVYFLETIIFSVPAPMFLLGCSLSHSFRARRLPACSRYDFFFVPVGYKLLLFLHGFSIAYLTLFLKNRFGTSKDLTFVWLNWF